MNQSHRLFIFLLAATLVFGITNVRAQTPTPQTSVTFLGEIYNHTDVPFWIGVGRPFAAQTAWLSGGYFVVSGQCGNQEKNSDYISARGEGNNKNVQGGLYVFKENGTLVGRRNVCHDGGMPGASIPSGTKLFCAEGQACDVSMYLTPTSPTSFVRELYERREYGFPRPLIHYAVGSSNVTIRSTTEKEELEDSPRITSSVRSGDSIIAVKREPVGSRGNYSDPVNATYSLKDLKEIDETGELLITPVVSVGDLIVAYDEQGTAGYKKGAGVFRSESDGAFELLHRLPPNVFPGVYDIDSANPLRIALAVPARSAFDNASLGLPAVFTKATYNIYEAGADGLTFVRTIPFAGGNASPYPVSDFAFSGDHAVVPFNGGFKLYKNDAEIASVTLPLTPQGSAYGTGNSQTPVALEMSPSGYILAAAPGYIYLYKAEGIGGGPADPPGTGGTTTPPFTGIGLSSLNDILGFATSYVGILQRLMGTSAIPRGTSFGETSTTSPAIQEAFDQMLRIMDSN